jgi:hypothetical protein
MTAPSGPGTVTDIIDNINGQGAAVPGGVVSTPQAAATSPPVAPPAAADTSNIPQGDAPFNSPSDPARTAGKRRWRRAAGIVADANGSKSGR